MASIAGYPAGVVTWNITGTLPPGITADMSVPNVLTFSGTPTQAGVFPFVVTAAIGAAVTTQNTGIGISSVTPPNPPPDYCNSTVMAKIVSYSSAAFAWDASGVLVGTYTGGDGNWVPYLGPNNYSSCFGFYSWAPGPWFYDSGAWYQGFPAGFCIPAVSVRAQASNSVWVGGGYGADVPPAGNTLTFYNIPYNTAPEWNGTFLMQDTVGAGVCASYYDLYATGATRQINQVVGIYLQLSRVTQTVITTSNFVVPAVGQQVVLQVSTPYVGSPGDTLIMTGNGNLRLGTFTVIAFDAFTLTLETVDSQDLGGTVLSGGLILFVAPWIWTFTIQGTLTNFNTLWNGTYTSTNGSPWGVYNSDNSGFFTGPATLTLAPVLKLCAPL